MNSTAQGILVVVALSLAGALLKHYFGIAAKAIIAGVIVLSAIGVSTIYSAQRARLRREMGAMSPGELSQYIDECQQAGLGNALKELSSLELSWTGKILDLLFGTTAAFGPPMVYHLASGRPLAWDAQFTGWHLLCMAVGVALYLTVRSRVVRSFTLNTEQGGGEVRSARGGPRAPHR